MPFRSVLRSCLMLALAWYGARVHAEMPVGPSEYGQILVAEYEVSSETVARFAAHRPSAGDPNESKLINAMLADTEDWVGPAQLMDASTNPYTLVVTLTGKARVDGDIHTLWHSGWRMDDGESKLLPFPGLSKTGVKAGEDVVIIRQSPPTSFSSNKTVAPVLALVRADNIRLESMKIQLWAGVGNPSKTEVAYSFHWLWVGLGMLLLFWWWRRGT